MSQAGHTLRPGDYQQTGHFGTSQASKSLTEHSNGQNEDINFQPISDSATTIYLSVTGGGSVGECGRLSQPSWLLGE